ncbi:MAG: beta-N-acetylhexosaminidase [Deltaproteobacteria bacterium]|nr:beta-N-acetylhexosaminidase [Deltaproteobacteria bacterium]
MNPILDLSEITQKVGRLFIGGMPGHKLDTNTIRLIKDYHLGGIILFRKNIVDPIQLARLCRDIQKVSFTNSGIPLFLAIDQEGGRVARLKEPFTQFPGNAAIGASPDPEESALRFASTTAKEMSLVGLNMNMAPVLDVAQPNMDPHLAGRCFSHDPIQITRLGRIVIDTLQQAGIMAVGKHFPGSGKSDRDPHLNLPTVHATLEEMESVHLPPFAGAIAAGVSAIMSSHATYPTLDPGVPATLSSKIMTELLREKMGFGGLVISDDLEMGAIEKERPLPEGAADAFIAGVDLLLICNNQERLIESLELIRNKVLRGDISYERLGESLERIASCKKQFLSNRPRTSFKAVREYFEALL